jgi:hypothetical protein
MPDNAALPSRVPKHDEQGVKSSDADRKVDEKISDPPNGGFKTWFRTFAAWMMFMAAWYEIALTVVMSKVADLSYGACSDFRRFPTILLVSLWTLGIQKGL